VNCPLALRQVIPAGCLDLPSNQGGGDSDRRLQGSVQLCRWFGRNFEPFDYQREVIEGLLERMGTGVCAGMLTLPTGAGKTAVGAIAALRDLAQLERGVVVWIAPQLELLDQARIAMERAWWTGFGPHSVDLMMLRPGECFVRSQRHSVVFTTPASARKWLTEVENSAAITHLVFDEAHHLGAEVFAETWSFARKRAAKLRLALGLSATPIRHGSSGAETLERSLDGTLFYPKRLAPNPIETLRARGVLSTLAVDTIPGIPRSAFAIDSAGKHHLAPLMSDADYWMACINATREERGRVFVFCPTRAAGALFSSHLCVLGETAEFIDGDDDLGTRIAVFERFRDGKTRIVVSVGLLLEGVDCPAAEAAIVTYPISSLVRALQVAGRISRGPAVGGTSIARLRCADPRLVRFFGSQASDVDFAAAWCDGVPL
jgi:superfamily II DNA or RNA helicase